jgi:hypothetical protein
VADEPTYSLLLLLAGLQIISRLGGNKSTGKGQCECMITQLKVNDKDCSASWPSWLDHLDDLTLYSDRLES